MQPLAPGVETDMIEAGSAVSAPARGMGGAPVRQLPPLGQGRVLVDVFTRMSVNGERHVPAALRCLQLFFLEIEDVLGR